MIYLNTYVIFNYLSPIKSKISNNLDIINSNILIINELNFIKKFNYDYNLPHIKSINIKIYQKYFGTNNKNKSKMKINLIIKIFTKLIEQN